jgi:hypothetical protein
MRVLGAIAFTLFLAAGLSAQTPVVRGSVGSVVHPAGNLPGVTRTPPSVVNPGGGGVHLIVPQQGQHRGNGNGNQIPRSYITAYPVYIGGYGDQPYIATQGQGDYPQQQQVSPNVTIIMPPQQTPNPVIINHYYPGASTDNPEAAPPAAQESAPAPEPEASHYLIAYKDHTIYAAVAYWVQGDTLHYFTSGNTHNQVSLSLVDRDLTARLNKDSGVEVKLPAPGK